MLPSFFLSFFTFIFFLSFFHVKFAFISSCNSCSSSSSSIGIIISIIGTSINIIPLFVIIIKCWCRSYFPFFLFFPLILPLIFSWARRDCSSWHTYTWSKKDLIPLTSCFIGFISFLVTRSGPENGVRVWLTISLVSSLSSSSLFSSSFFIWYFANVIKAIHTSRMANVPPSPEERRRIIWKNRVSEREREKKRKREIQMYDCVHPSPGKNKTKQNKKKKPSKKSYFEFCVPPR